jgi:hypothetical protein
MRYSRLLEENSFSNRRADYVWLLTLCGTFLLVRPYTYLRLALVVLLVAWVLRPPVLACQAMKEP